MTTGQLIKAARKKAGMTQAELAQKLGISYVGISQWENNLRNPKHETLKRIAKALGVEWADLVPEEERGQKAVDHIRDELEKIGLEANFSSDDEEILKILLPYAADPDPLTDEESALKTLLNSLGYNIMKVRGDYFFSYESGGSKISKDDLNELLSCALNGLKIAAKTLELKKLRETFGPNYPGEIVVPCPPPSSKNEEAAKSDLATKVDALEQQNRELAAKIAAIEEKEEEINNLGGGETGNNVG